MQGRFRPTTPRPAASSSETSPPPEQVADFIGARVHVDIVIPRTNVAGKMRLVSRKEEFEVDAETRAWLAEYGFPIDGTGHAALGTSVTWSYERQARILAIAVRDPKNPALALATADEYRDLDDDQLDALGARYRDLQLQLDPIGTVSITPAELDKMLDAAKKKDVVSLMQFGCSKLARFAITSA